MPSGASPRNIQSAGWPCPRASARRREWPPGRPGGEARGPSLRRLLPDRLLDGQQRRMLRRRPGRVRRVPGQSISVTLMPNRPAPRPGAGRTLPAPTSRRGMRPCAGTPRCLQPTTPARPPRNPAGLATRALPRPTRADARRRAADRRDDQTSGAAPASSPTATSARCSPARTTSTCSSTTAPSAPTRTTSSLAATTTSPRGLSPYGATALSPANPSPPCCSTSPPTTAPVVGERSTTHRKPNPNTVWLQLSPHEAPQTAHCQGGNACRPRDSGPSAPKAPGRRASHMSRPMKCPLTGRLRQPQQFLRRARAPDPCGERTSIAHCPMRR
jgi:hypothetical protein